MSNGVFPGLEGLADRRQAERDEARREAEQLLGKGDENE